jgi:cytochrome c peroxidase
VGEKIKFRSLTISFVLATLMAGVVGAQQAPAPLAPLPAVPIPQGNLQTPQKVELGKLLFFDPRLSGDGSISCASCHDPVKGWGDGKALSEGYPGTQHYRNAQTILNSAYLKELFWYGGVADLETAVRVHLTSAFLMNADGQLLEERLRQVPEYSRRFQEIFGTLPMYGQIVNAISSYLRTIVSRDVPFDRYLRGDKESLTPLAIKGLELFQGKAQCSLCHNGALLSDEKYYNVGVPANPEIRSNPLRHVSLRFDGLMLGVPGYNRATQDIGRYMITKQNKDKGLFRTPTLREVARTAPYMHNGIFSTLDEVIDFYDRGGGSDSFGTKSPLLKALGLTKEEKAALRVFLESLSSANNEEEKTPKPHDYQVLPLGKWEMSK